MRIVVVSPPALPNRFTYARYAFKELVFGTIGLNSGNLKLRSSPMQSEVTALMNHDCVHLKMMVHKRLSQATRICGQLLATAVCASSDTRSKSDKDKPEQTILLGH